MMQKALENRGYLFDDQFHSDREYVVLQSIRYKGEPKGILDEIALIKYRQFESGATETKNAEKAWDNLEKHLKNFSEVEGYITDLLAAECENHFIQGFIEGCRFLQCINTEMSSLKKVDNL